MRTRRKIRRRKMRPDTAYTTAEVNEIETLARPGPDMRSRVVSSGAPDTMCYWPLSVCE